MAHPLSKSKTVTFTDWTTKSTQDLWGKIQRPSARIGLSISVEFNLRCLKNRALYSIAVRAEFQLKFPIYQHSLLKFQKITTEPSLWGCGTHSRTASLGGTTFVNEIV